MSEPQREYAVESTTDAFEYVVTFSDGCKIKTYGSRGHAVRIASHNKRHDQHKGFEPYTGEPPVPVPSDPLADYKQAVRELRIAAGTAVASWEEGDLASAIRQLAGACGKFDANRHALD